MTYEFLYLASASPRRRELLDQIGVPYQVRPADIDESPLPGERPREYVVRIAQAKAEAIWAGLAPQDRQPVLAADTTVTIDGEVLSKPDNKTQALAMLARLSGRTHEVLTAVALRDAEGLHARLSLSSVSFRQIAAKEAEIYWGTGEPRDKAGAYAVQGYAAVFIERIEGSYSGIMGLPLFETAELLGKCAMKIWNGEYPNDAPDSARLAEAPGKEGKGNLS